MCVLISAREPIFIVVTDKLFIIEGSLSIEAAWEIVVGKELVDLAHMAKKRETCTEMSLVCRIWYIPALETMC